VLEAYNYSKEDKLCPVIQAEKFSDMMEAGIPNKFFG
jgi:hypothetical protein